MNPIDQAWAIIKQSDDYGDVATSLQGAEEVCPECDGDGEISAPSLGIGMKDCPVCQGTGIKKEHRENKAWATLKAHRNSGDGNEDEDELDPVEFGDYGMTDEDDHGEHQTSSCELCGERITFDEVGGFTDSGPHCKECDNNLCKHCNGDGYHGDAGNMSGDYGSDSQMCEECQGSGLASGPPKKDDYMPSDGEGYEGALNEWKDKYGNQ